jgi:hypothetical protein
MLWPAVRWLLFWAAFSGDPGIPKFQVRGMFAEARGAFPRILQPKRRIKDGCSIAKLCTEKMPGQKGRTEHRWTVAGAEAGARVTGVRIPRRIGG